MRRPRLPGWLRLEGLPEDRRRVRHSTPLRPARIRPIAGTHFYSRHQSRSGHDENISFEETVKIIGVAAAEKLRDLTIAIYKKASEYARTKGIIIADTKLEFGTVDGVITLADEVLTPDSSRFWRASDYEPGKSQPSFDKQFVRDYLESIHWNQAAARASSAGRRRPKTSDKYKEAYRILSGREL